MKPQSAKRKRGFACMAPAAVRAICSMGGRAVFEKRGVKHMAKIGKAGGKSPKGAP